MPGCFIIGLIVVYPVQQLQMFVFFFFEQIDDLYHATGRWKGSMKGKYQKQEKVLNKNTELAKLYDAYQKALRTEKIYDYSDMIMEVNNTAVASVKEYQAAMSKVKKESVARLLIKRTGRTLYLTVEIPK